jgi:hypothetical protein
MRFPRLFPSLSRNDNDAVGDGQVGGINPAFNIFFRKSRNLRRDHTSGVALRRRVNPILKGAIRFKNSKNCHTHLRAALRYITGDRGYASARQARQDFKLRHYPLRRYPGHLALTLPITQPPLPGSRLWELGSDSGH